MAENKKQNEKNYKDYTDEEKTDLMIITGLGFACIFICLLALYVGFVVGRRKPRTPGIILGVLGFLLLDEARKEAGSIMNIIRGALSDSPKLTFENAQKDMEEFIKERDAEEETHQKER